MLTWSDLETYALPEPDRINGPTNAQARLRLFGQPERAVRVTLYRDHHAWCPYCQKVWLWLETKQIPYRIEKVTMFCYGTKESWYKRLVPSGMLPAIAIDGRLTTESDDILLALERTFGPLGISLREISELRQLERRLFRAWCSWLCYPSRSAQADAANQTEFSAVATTVEAALERTAGAFFLGEQFTAADVIFVPYVERMHASLFYYKGYSLRDQHPRLAAWFDGLETLGEYRGSQSDFHTHAHDLPPQMGGCYSNDTTQARHNQTRVDQGPWFGLPDVHYPEPATAQAEALTRVLKHRQAIVAVNPCDSATFAPALRAALTCMVTGEACPPPPGTELGLRYLRDRINVPRDMSIYAAKHLRTALEATAALSGDREPEPLPLSHRRDQDPARFLTSV